MSYYHLLIQRFQSFAILLQVIYKIISNYAKITQPGGFPGKSLKLLLKTGLLLMKNVFEILAKSVLISIGLTAAVSAADKQIHQKFSIPDLGILEPW